MSNPRVTSGVARMRLTYVLTISWASGMRRQSRIARPSPSGTPMTIPAKDSATVTPAPCRRLMRSADVMAGMTMPPVRRILHSPALELRLPLRGKIRERLTEPFLLQLRKGTVLLLLGEEAVEEHQKLGIALGNRPRRVRFARYRQPYLEHGGLLLHQRLEVDDRVDHEIRALERKVLIRLRVGGVFDHLADLAPRLSKHRLKFGQALQQAASSLDA